MEEVVPRKKIIWRLEKFGITAIHEYNFHETDRGVSVTSRETFYGGLIALSVILFPMERLRELTLMHLTNLKEAAESGKDNGTKD